MDITTLVDICFALGAVLGAGMMLYGAWLCLPVDDPRAAKASRDERQSEAVVREPRRRIRAGTGERELRGSESRV